MYDSQDIKTMTQTQAITIKTIMCILDGSRLGYTNMDKTILFIQISMSLLIKPNL